MTDWNAAIIEEFRANGGKVGGQFEGGNLLLLHHKGARTGIERVNPVAYLPDGDRMIIAASKGGAPTNPDWYHNIKANPETTAEVGTQTVPVTAAELEGEEYAEIWDRFCAAMPGFADYQTKTTRRIPLFALARG